MGKVNRTSGSLLVNGKESEMSAYRKVIGFVPQEDTMLRELTVYENILHSARIRLPSSWSRKEIVEHCDTIIKALNLENVKHTPIGDETTRGISGGQRKRVNIALELAGIPLALFLDEPTRFVDSLTRSAVLIRLVLYLFVKS